MIIPQSELKVQLVDFGGGSIFIVYSPSVILGKVRKCSKALTHVAPCGHTPSSGYFIAMCKDQYITMILQEQASNSPAKKLLEHAVLSASTALNVWYGFPVYNPHTCLTRKTV